MRTGRLEYKVLPIVCLCDPVSCAFYDMIRMKNSIKCDERIDDNVKIVRIGEGDNIIGVLNCDTIEVQEKMIRLIEEKICCHFHTILVVSRHQSRSRIKCFTLHYTGAPTVRTQYVERKIDVCFACPSLMSFIAKRMYEEFNEEFYVEANHHGPLTRSYGVIFVEIGSCREDWWDCNNIVRFFKCVYDLVSSMRGNNMEVSLEDIVRMYIGTVHYIKYSELRGGIAHIIPRYALNDISSHSELLGMLLKICLCKSFEKVKEIVCWKVSSDIRQKVREFCKRVGVEFRYSG